MASRWSLRGMLLLLCGAAVLFAIVQHVFLTRTPEERLYAAGAARHRVTIDDAAPIEVLELDGAAIDARFAADAASLSPAVNDLVLREGSISPEAAERFATFPQLRFVACDRSNVDDRRVAALARATTLRAISLRDCDVTDAGLAALAALPRLSHLDLAGTKLTDGGAALLARLPSLVSIDVSRTAIGDAGAAALLAAPRLERINLARTAATDAAFARLPADAPLLDVSAHDARVGDDAARRLAALPRLREALLNGTRMTPEGTRALLASKSLRGLCVDVRAITDELRDAASRDSIELLVSDELSLAEAAAALRWSIDAQRREPPVTVEVETRREQSRGSTRSTYDDGRPRGAVAAAERYFDLIGLIRSRGQSDFSSRPWGGPFARP